MSMDGISYFAGNLVFDGVTIDVRVVHVLIDEMQQDGLQFLSLSQAHRLGIPRLSINALQRIVSSVNADEDLFFSYPQLERSGDIQDLHADDC